MIKRCILLVCCLTLAGCGSSSVEVVSGNDSPNSSTDGSEVVDMAEVIESTTVPNETTTTVLNETTTTTASPVPDGTAAEELATLLVDSDFDVRAAEQQCLSEQFSERLTDDEARALIEGSDENLDADDPLIDTAVIVYEGLGFCLGGERIVEVILEPEYNPEGHACFVEAFPSEQEQIDAMVAVMTVELGDLPEPPEQYQGIYDQVGAACSDLE